MPRSTEQFQQIREESCDRILNTALGMFARHGYAATSVRMIAGEAGISQGLLYNYFDGKDALLRTIFERSMRDVQASFEVAAGGTTPGERIERLIRGAFALVRERLDFWRITYQLRFQPAVLAGVGGALQTWSDPIRQHLEELLAMAGASAPATGAYVLFAAIDGAAQHYALDPDHYPLDDVAGVLIRSFTAQQEQSE